MKYNPKAASPAHLATCASCGTGELEHEWHCDVCGKQSVIFEACGCGATHLPTSPCACGRSLSLLCPARLRTITAEQYLQHWRRSPLPRCAWEDAESDRLAIAAGLDFAALKSQAWDLST